MSSADAAAVGGQEQAAYAWHAVLRKLRLLPAVVLVAAGAAAIPLVGDVLQRPRSFAFLSAYSVVAFGLAGGLWLRLRPTSRIGLLLLSLVPVAALQSFQGSASPLPFSLGVLVDPVFVLIAWFALLSFPLTRLTPVAAGTYAVAVLGVVLGFVPWFFLSSQVAGGTPLARCTAACPTNALLIANRPNAAARFETAQHVCAVGFAIAFLVFATIRFLAATRPRRRVLAPVYAVGAFWLACFGSYQLAADLVVVNAQLSATLGWLQTAAQVAFPLSFVLALVHARTFNARALQSLLDRLAVRPGTAELERVSREALGDPSLELALWQPESDEWTDAQGQPLGDDRHDGSRSSRVLRSDGRPVAELRYDSVLDDDPELVGAAASAILLSLDRGAILSQLRRSERRIAAAGQAERRRLERNLHDSAQQRLVALQVRMSLVTERLTDDPDGARAELDSLKHEVDAALEEIRTVAHGAYPATLREEGVGPALSDAVRTHPRARISRGALGRYPDDVEAAVYFAALEALQNASKHGGPDVQILVSLWEEAGALRFEVRDNGCGFDASAIRNDGGVAGISERVRAFGGTVEITSTSERGTRVVGAVPV